MLKNARWARALAVAAIALGAIAAQAAEFSFAVFGDAPYAAREETAVDTMIERINADPALAFTLHVGDVKGGSQRCDDALLNERLRQLQRFARPLIFTPGDNDWTDCHRSPAGRYNPVERLQRLRALFYPDPHRSLGQAPLAVITQGDTPRFAAFVENTRFVHDGVVFIGIHVVGSSNGLDPWDGLDPNDSESQPRPDRWHEFITRRDAVLDWLEQGFAAARRDQAQAVVIFMQANPRFDRSPKSRARAGFNDVLTRLHTLASAYGKPVLLLHGDDHVYVVDRPWEGERQQPVDLLRVQTVGSPLVGFVRVTVRPGAREPFEVSAQLESLAALAR